MPIGTGIAVAVAIAILELHLEEVRNGHPPPGKRPLPDGLIHRPEEVSRIVAAVLASNGMVAVAGLRGAHGFGKSTLAAVVANDDRVRRHFDDRVFWFDVGRDAQGPEALARKVNELVQLITAEKPTFTDPGRAGEYLSRVLEGQPRMLLVLDDVWSGVQLAPFLKGGAQCVRLVTTPVADVLPGESTPVPVGAMAVDQARSLLSWQLPSPLSEPLVSDLMRVTGRWPLLLHLVNRAIADRINNSTNVDDAARQIHEAVVSQGPTAEELHLNDPDAQRRLIRPTVDAAAALKPRLVELGVFAEAESVPVDVVGILWAATAEVGPDRARSLCGKLAGLALIIMEDDEGRLLVRMHHPIRALLRAELGDRLSGVNATLLDAIAGTLPPAELTTVDGRPGVAWWCLSEHERYLWDQIPYHLVQAGRGVERDAVVTDLRWVGQRLRLFGPAAPATDLVGAGSTRASALAENLEQASHLLTPTSPPYSVIDVLLSRLRDDPTWKDAVDRVQDEQAWPHLRNLWPLPDRADPAMRRALIGHAAGVRAVAWSPDGARLATGGGDETVRIWDPATATITHAFSGHAGGVWGLAWSPDGARLATGGGDGTARIWDPATTTITHALTGHAGGVWTVAWSPDGARLATASDDGTVRIWDASTARTVHHLVGHADWVRAVAWSPDGTRLATASHDQTVRIWDAGTASNVHVLTGHTGTVWAVAWSPDGARLATAGGDEKVRIWDPTAETTVHVLTGHIGWVLAVAWSPDGARLASADVDETVRIWDLDAEATVHMLAGHTGRVWEAGWSPDGGRLATASHDGTVRIWDPATARTTHARSSSVRALGWSPDGARLASAHTDGHDQTVRIWDRASATVGHVLTGHSGMVLAVGWSPNSSRLATAGHDARVRIWDPNTATTILILTGHEATVWAVAWSPDGGRLATAGHDETVRIWDLDTGMTTRILTGHTGAVLAVAWSPDGTRLASAGHDKTVRVWDRDTVHVLTGHTDWVLAVAWSPDGTRLATASYDGTVRIWELNTATTKHVLDGHTGMVLAVAWSPDGTLLATASYDHTVRIWDAIGYACVAMMRVEAALMACAWAPNSHMLAAAGVLGIYVFNHHPGSIKQQ